MKYKIGDKVDYIYNADTEEGVPEDIHGIIEGFFHIKDNPINYYIELGGRPYGEEMTHIWCKEEELTLSYSQVIEKAIESMEREAGC